MGALVTDTVLCVFLLNSSFRFGADSGLGRVFFVGGGSFAGVVDLVDGSLVEVHNEDDVWVRTGVPSRKYMRRRSIGMLTMMAKKSSRMVLMKRYIMPRQFMCSTLRSL